MHTDLTFFTNEPDRNLYDRFSNILKSNTQFFDVLVGYFRTSGFFKMYEAMADVEKIRILVGLNVDKYTVKIIDRANNEIAFDKLTTKEAKEAFNEDVVNEFEKSETNASIEQGVRTFIEWLRNGKLEMRMYVDAPIHAKVYIMRKDMDKTPDTYGSVITGSRNFSEAGLQNNLEFNVELKDSRDVQFALEKFEDLWVKSVPVTDEYIEAVEKKTWLRNDITPYEIYLKTLYEFFKEEINSDKDLLGDDLLPDGYMKLQYQLDAVVQARKILETYNGVFISDVVGLGKTYISAMLAKALPKGKKLIICPPVLVDYWKEVLLEFDVAAEVESLGKLEKILDKGVDKFKYIFIDEAHRFRNQGTESFSNLHKICYGKKVVLISATPINNYSSDIENQLYLFQPKHDSTIIGLRDLEAFFKELHRKENKYSKETQLYVDQLRANSEDIQGQLGHKTDVSEIDKELDNYHKLIKKLEKSKSNLERDIDAIYDDDKYAERKRQDMNNRLNKIYEEIYDIEDRITDSEKKKEAAQQDVLTKENVFKMLLVFDKVFDKMNDADKRKLIESMIAEIHLHPKETWEEGKNPIKEIKYAFPVSKEVMEALRENVASVETVVGLQRKSM